MLPGEPLLGLVLCSLVLSGEARNGNAWTLQNLEHNSMCHKWHELMESRGIARTGQAWLRKARSRQARFGPAGYCRALQCDLRRSKAR